MEHRTVDGRHQTRNFMHKVILSGGAGDTPVIRKFTRWGGHSAILGCGRCLLRGINERCGTHFFGYSSPTPYGSFLEPTPKGACFAGDSDCKLSAHDQVLRAELLEDERKSGASKAAIRKLVRAVGCHGMSPIVQALPYLHYNNAFPIPIAHCGPYGIVKDFWSYMLSAKDLDPDVQLSRECITLIQQRGGDIVNTNDFGREYIDICSNRGNMVMESWLHWLESWSVYILRNESGTSILPPVVEEMWDCLRRGLLYFMRLYPTPDIPSTCEEAVALLKRYGTIAQEHGLHKLCTYNLHVAICCLSDQEQARGKVAFGSEYWIENMIQSCKSVILGRTTKFPEITLVKHLLLKQGLANLKAGGEVTTLDSLGPGARPRTGRDLDDGDVEGCILCGSGTLLNDGMPDYRIGRDALGRLRNDFAGRLEELGWDAEQFDEADMIKYSFANTGGDRNETVHSVTYDRPSKTASYYARVSYFEHDTVLVDYVARIIFFLKVVPKGLTTGSGRPTPIRVAVADLIKVSEDRTASGILWKGRSDRGSKYAVMFEDMRGKVISATRSTQAGTSATGSTRANPIWFVPYGNLSGS